MAATLSDRVARVISVDRIGRPMQAKASLRFSDIEARERIARAVSDGVAGWDLKVLADLLDRDERQISRWKDGKERPQLDAMLNAPEVYDAVLLALCGLSDRVEVETRVRFVSGRRA